MSAATAQVAAAAAVPRRARRRQRRGRRPDQRLPPRRGRRRADGLGPAAGGFNYYQTVGPQLGLGVRRQLAARPRPTRPQGKGPFESHLSGNVVMKELRFPWLHWHSFAAEHPAVGAARGPAARRPPLGDRHQAGRRRGLRAPVAIPSIRRWTRARFDRLLANGGVVDDPGRILLQVLGTPSVNLVTGPRESRSFAAGDAVVLPRAFFVDTEGARPRSSAAPAAAVLRPRRDLPAEPDRLRVTGGRRQGFVRPGDTHFPFAVPERRVRGPGRPRGGARARAADPAAGRLPADDRLPQPGLLAAPRRPAGPRAGAGDGDRRREQLLRRDGRRHRRGGAGAPRRAAPSGSSPRAGTGARTSTPSAPSCRPTTPR